MRLAQRHRQPYEGYTTRADRLVRTDHERGPATARAAIASDPSRTRRGDCWRSGRLSSSGGKPSDPPNQKNASHPKTASQARKAVPLNTSSGRLPWRGWAVSRMIDGASVLDWRLAAELLERPILASLFLPICRPIRASARVLRGLRKRIVGTSSSV